MGADMTFALARRRNRRRPAAWPVGVLAAATLAAGIVTPAAGPAHADNAHLINLFAPTAGPLGSVSFIGDSVGIGAGRFSPTLPDLLAARGWGPIRFYALDGNRTGLEPGWPEAADSAHTIDAWQAAGWDSDTWIINLGTNDSGYCYADVACARRGIMRVVDAIGPGHRIWWPKITRHPVLQYQGDTWNTALDQIADERTDFFTWDWPTEMWSHPDIYGSWDGTHLYPDGYRYRSQVMAVEFTEAVARSHRVGGDVPLPTATGPRSELVPVTPSRVIDTRRDPPGKLAAGATLTVDLSRDVPAGATAVAVNLTAAAPGGPGFLTAHACGGRRPTASNVNYVDRPQAASAIVQLSAARTICVYTSASAHVIVDLQAVLVPEGADADAARLTPLATPKRLLDTRRTGRASELRVSVQSGATAVAVNLTVTQTARPGFLAAYPCGGDPPPVSNVNFGPRETVAGFAFVAVGSRQAICIRTSAPADVIVDLTASLAPGTGAAFVAVAPTRVLDTRTAIGGWTPILGRDDRIDVRVAPSGATAVSGTITLVRPIAPLYLTAARCNGAWPATSSVNGAAGSVVANALTVGVDGRLCLDASSPTHALFDVTGWWVD